MIYNDVLIATAIQLIKLAIIDWYYILQDDNCQRDSKVRIDGIDFYDDM